jgi:arsenate reductase
MQSMQEIQKQLVKDFSFLETGNEKFDYLIDLGQSMPEMGPAKKTEANLVKGCQSNVWFDARCEDGRLHLEADSDSLIVKGLAAMLVQILSGQDASEILNADMSFIEEIGLWRQLSSQRGTGLTAMLAHIRSTAETCQEKQPKKRVLFLCTGNSCRSQMAEAIVNARYNESWQAFSAGTRPAGYVHPKALAALQEIGIQHKGYSKSVEEYRQKEFDLVVTVCDSASEECPVWLGKGKRVHRSFPDPALTDDMQDFRHVRDALALEIPTLLAEFEKTKGVKNKLDESHG